MQLLIVVQAQFEVVVLGSDSTVNSVAFSPQANYTD
jgi:hypothetical protein